MTVDWSPSTDTLVAARDHAVAGDWPDHHDGGRSDRAQQRRDNFAGKLGEGVVSEWLESMCVPHEWDAMDDDPTAADITAYGVEIDVKTRYPWTAPNCEPDLLVTTSRATPDIYLLAEVMPGSGGWSASIVGWIGHDDARACWQDFSAGHTADKLVARGDLRSPASILGGFVQMTQNTAQDGQTAP